MTLPFVALRMAFISLNVIDGLTARALTMARRVFSWMTRSRSTAVSGATVAGAFFPCVVFTVAAFAAALLATVPPCDHEAKHDVQPPEPDAEQRIADGDRRHESGAAEEHETDAHDRDGRDGKRAAADESRAVAK